MVTVNGSGYFSEILPPNSGLAVGFTVNASGSATEVKNGSNRLAGRRGIYLKNRSDVPVLWGYASDSCVFPLEAESSASAGDGGSIYIDVGDNQGVYVQASSGSGKTVACAEVK